MIAAIDATTAIERLGLSVRLSAVLRLAGLVTVGQVAALTADQLRALPNFSPACLEELLGVLAERAHASKVAGPLLSAEEIVQRLERTAQWLAGECERIGDDWARTHAELELVLARLEAAQRGEVLA